MAVGSPVEVAVGVGPGVGVSVAVGVIVGVGGNGVSVGGSTVGVKVGCRTGVKKTIGVGEGVSGGKSRMKLVNEQPIVPKSATSARARTPAMRRGLAAKPAVRGLMAAHEGGWPSGACVGAGASRLTDVAEANIHLPIRVRWLRRERNRFGDRVAGRVSQVGYIRACAGRKERKLQVERLAIAKTWRL